jgi:hypothetical protein
MLVKLVGFMPDADQTVQGAILDCTNLIPTTKGTFRPANSLITLPQGALPSACTGAYLAIQLSGATRFIAGTTTGLFTNTLTGWTNISRGGGYTGSSDQPWTFTQFGNITIAVNKANEMQFSSGAAFTNIAGAPKASIVRSLKNFVFAFDTTENTSGDAANRWQTSAIGDYTDWELNIDKRCVAGTLVDSPGGITAAWPLGDNMIVYKDNDMYIGHDVGPPFSWEFTKLPGRIGTPGPYSVVDIETAHIFVGPDDFYLFDGSRAVPLDPEGSVKKFFFKDLNEQFAYKIVCLHDSNEYIVRFFYPSQSSTTGALDRCLVYNYRANKWGRHDIPIEFAADYATPALTYGDIPSIAATYADIPLITYGSPFWTQTKKLPGVISPLHQVQTLSGPPTQSSITTHDIGTDMLSTFVRRVRNRYALSPTTSATLHSSYRDNLGKQLVTDYTVPEEDGKFDFRRSARWHRFTMNFEGDYEIYAYDVDLKAHGPR